MNRIAGLVTPVVLSGATMLFAIPAVAQLRETSVVGQSALAKDNAVPGLTIADVEAALAAIEADTGIEDGVKSQLRSTYDQAIDALRQAADFATRATEFGDAVTAAPERTSQLRSELQASSLVEDAAEISATGGSEQLQAQSDSLRAALISLTESQTRTSADLVRLPQRSTEIGARLPEAERELAEIRRQLDAAPPGPEAASPGAVADRVLLEARQSRLIAELAMLQQEQLSQPAREGLLRAQQDVLARKIENANATLSALEALVHQRSMNEVRRFRTLVDELMEQVTGSDETALAAEIRALTVEFETVVRDRQVVTAARRDVTTRLTELTEEDENVREQLELGGGGRAIVQVLFDLQSRALDARKDMAATPLPPLDAARLGLLEVKKKVRGHSKVQDHFAGRPSASVTRLVETRLDVLEQLQTQYERLIRARAKLAVEQTQFVAKAEEVHDYAMAQLFGFGLRSSPPVSPQTLTDLPGAVKWAFRPDHLAELGRGLIWIGRHRPLLSLGIVLAVALLVLARQRIAGALDKTRMSIRRISTDSYAHTARALVWTILLAAPIPLMLGFFAWSLGLIPSSSDWLWGLTYGLQISAQVAWASTLMAAACRPKGLGVVHFGWPLDSTARLQTSVHMFAIVYIPSILLTTSCAFGDASQYFDSLGRVSFLLAQLWTVVVLRRWLLGSGGLMARLAEERPARSGARLRYAWCGLVLAAPLALAILACFGYLITAVQLSLGLFATAVLIFGGFLLYGLTLRWFSIRHRRLALAEARERRRAQREERESDEEAEPIGEIVTVDPDDEEEMDLEVVSEQTQALIRLFAILAVITTILLYWSGTFPLIESLDAVPVPLLQTLSLLGLVQVVLIIVVTVIAVRNLPGVLELAVLRATSIDPGTRNAIATLCQYGVIGIGLTLLFSVLQVDWSRFGWIAAALSVGLGFGLQEVVSNFVCGIILLFERPIRVGDVVTIEGMTGTVTKIHLRATTITNWDRHEFVVPNKTLITTTLLNWTLTAPLTRVVVPVGVAYGTDTELARQILLAVATEHPRVLDDPAPMATFEQFADSSLNLVLRAFLPDLQNRLGTITELHTEIGKRFAAAGIEIAFPQRDIHIRHGSTSLPGVAPAGQSDVERR